MQLKGKRIATSFKWSEDDWENNPLVKADIKYIKDNLDSPWEFSLVYSEWFDFHINNAFEKKYKISYNIPPKKDKVIHQISILADYFEKIIGTDIEQFGLTIADDIMSRCIAIGDIDGFFEWMQRKGNVACSCYPHDVFQDDHVSMKYIYHRPVLQFRELLGAYGYTKSSPELTKYGKAHELEVFSEAQRLYEELNNPYILDSFVDSNQIEYESKFRVVYPRKCIVETNPYSLCLYTNERFVAFVKNILRTAENNVREFNNISKVGEGWIAETELYNKLVEAYPNNTIIHGYRSKWLGLQHIDVFIEEYKIAIEYQGIQHFTSVERFGGNEGVLRNKRRDEEKKQKCITNGYHLIWVCEGYDFDRLTTIINRLKRNTLKPEFYVLSNKDDG